MALTLSLCCLVMCACLGAFFTVLTFAYVAVGRIDWIDDKELVGIVTGTGCLVGGVAWWFVDGLIPGHGWWLLWFGFVLLLAVVAALAFNRAPFRRHLLRLKGRRGERKVASLVRRAGFEALHDVYLEDDRGIVQVDHLVRTGKHVVALETKNHSGRIFAKAQDGSWTRSFEDGGTLRIDNPLGQVERHAQVLRHVLGSKVTGLVVFTDLAEFPKGTPPNVVMADRLAVSLRALDDTKPDYEAEDVWARLTAAVASTDQDELRDAHERQTARHEMFGSGRVPARSCVHCGSCTPEADFGYSWHWRCACGRYTGIRVPDGYDLVETGTDLTCRDPSGYVTVLGPLSTRRRTATAKGRSPEPCPSAAPASPASGPRGGPPPGRANLGWRRTT